MSEWRNRMGRAALVMMVCALGVVAGCTRTGPKPSVGPDKEPPAVRADDPVAQVRFDEAKAALDAGKWGRARELMVLVKAKHQGDAIAPVAELYLVRAELGAVRAEADGTLRCDADAARLDEAAARLDALITSARDARLRWAATLYRALVDQLKGQPDRALARLKDYPSATLNGVVLAQDRLWLWGLLEEGFGRAGRALEQVMAADATYRLGRKLLAAEVARGLERPASELEASADLMRLAPRSPLRAMVELAEARAFEAAASPTLDREALELELFQSSSPLLKAAAGWTIARARLLKAETIDEDAQVELERLVQETNVALLRVHQGVKAQELSTLLATSRSSKRLVIGALVPLSGKTRAIGERALRGIMLASEAYGVGKSARVTLIIRDSQGDPEANMRAFAEAGALAVVGPIARQTIARYAPLANAQKLPLLTLGAEAMTSQGVDADGKNMVFRHFMDAPAEARAVARVSAGPMKDRVAVVLQPTIGYGKLMADAFSAEFTARGGKVTRLTYKRGTTDHAGLARRVAALKPQAIFIPDTPDQVSQIATFLARENLWGIDALKPARRDGTRRHVHYLGTSVWQHPLLLKLGASYVAGATVPVWYAPALPGEAAAVFGRRFAEVFGQEPDPYAAFGYDAAMILRSALLERGVRRPDRVRAALIGERGFEGMMGRVQWRAWGEASRRVRFITVSGRAWAPLKLDADVSAGTPKPESSSMTPARP